MYAHVSWVWIFILSMKKWHRFGSVLNPSLSGRLCILKQSRCVEVNSSPVAVMNIHVYASPRAVSTSSCCPFINILILPICNGTQKTFLFSWLRLRLQWNCIYCVVCSYSLLHLLLLWFLLGNQHFSHSSLYLEAAMLVQKNLIFFSWGKTSGVTNKWLHQSYMEICWGWK